MRKEAEAAAFVAGALDDDAEIKRLAGLTQLNYYRARAAAAKNLHCPVTVLDKLVAVERAKVAPAGEGGQGRRLELSDREPWHEAVDGAALLDELSAAIGRHVVLDKAARDAAALWVVATHAFDSFQIFPRLFITAPTKGAGKSTLLDTLEPLLPRPLQVASATAAALFRFIPLARPVLLLDEADAWARDNEDVRAVLDAGHKRGAMVLRCVGDDNEPRAFDVFAPAVFAAIGRLPDTIEDRSVIITLQRKRPDEKVMPTRAGREALDRLARQAARWAADHAPALIDAAPSMPDGIANRAADNWAPLLAVADLIGGEWPARARAAATALTGGEDQSREIMLLADVRRVFEAAGSDRLTSEELAARLGEMDDRPWAEYRAGKPITKGQLGRALGRLGILGGTVRLAQDNTKKGYYRDAFSDAFARYLPGKPPTQNVTTSQIDNGGDFREFSKWHNVASAAACDVLEKCEKPNNDGHCDGVTFLAPPLAEEPAVDNEDEERAAIVEYEGQVYAGPGSAIVAADPLEIPQFLRRSQRK